MSDPHLILHKVRGQPAFDIAIPVTIGEEEGWVIPTSGHRAYPVESWELGELLHYACIDWPSPPLDKVPDHYQVNPAPSLPLTTASALLAKLGLGPKAIKRRRID